MLPSLYKIKPPTLALYSSTKHALKQFNAILLSPLINYLLSKAMTSYKGINYLTLLNQTHFSNSNSTDTPSLKTLLTKWNILSPILPVISMYLLKITMKYQQNKQMYLTPKSIFLYSELTKNILELSIKLYKLESPMTPNYLLLLMQTVPITLILFT